MNGADGPEAKPETTYPFLSIADIRNLPTPEWLIDDLVPKGGLAILFGPPGSYKTFLALAWAAAIADGNPWLGRPVKSGPVVYIAGEGSRGLGQRFDALARSVGYSDDLPIKILPAGIQFQDRKSVKIFTEDLNILGVKPALIVIDTFARCFVGGDENSAKDVGFFINNVTDILQQSGATVLVLHHTGKKESSGLRGSSALEGAADTVVEARPVKNNNGVIKLNCTKQKDAEEFSPISLKLKQVDLGEGQTSCVLERADGSGSGKSGLPERALKSLETLKEIGPTTHGKWKKAAMAQHGFSESTFNRTLEDFGDHDGYISVTGEGQGAKYSTVVETSPSTDDEIMEKLFGDGIMEAMDTGD